MPGEAVSVEYCGNLVMPLFWKELLPFMVCILSINFYMLVYNSKNNRSTSNKTLIT